MDNCYERFEAIGIVFGRDFSIVSTNDDYVIKHNYIVIPQEAVFAFDIDLFGDIKLVVKNPDKYEQPYMQAHLVDFLMAGKYRIVYHDFKPEKENHSYYTVTWVKGCPNPSTTSHCWHENSKYQQALLKNGLVFAYESGARRFIARYPDKVREILREIEGN